MPSCRTQSMRWIAAALIGISFGPCASADPDANTAPVAFNRDIVPMLSTKCFACHGPDAPPRKAGLRLDKEGEATSVLPSGETAIIPGNPDASALMKRILSDDPEEQMPPPETGKSLSAKERDLLRQWIAQGAPWEAHWAFIPPALPAAPPVRDGIWPRNPIDNFVLARLEAEDIAPSPEADRYTLIRRLSLDLTGLPPSPAEVDAFVKDPDPNAYGALVERLLASPRYGEHRARYWLDLARYADTNGYAADIERTMWRYRDWVIDAFNDNMPFDQFTIEQLAGDLLPKPSLAQRIATGFNRNHPIMMEGGAIFEEYRVENVVDRSHTTATTWLGLTMKCAQCHDHKYDPISQREFYEFYAFFNNGTEEESKLFGTELDGNSLPRIKAPLPEQEEETARLARKLAALKEEMLRPIPEVDAAQRDWEVGARGAVSEQWRAMEAVAVPPAGAQDPSTLTLYGATALTTVTALRLDVLPEVGEGGTATPVALSEIALFVTSPSGEEVPVSFVQVTASTPEGNRLIDGDAEKVWRGNTHDVAILSLGQVMGLAERTRIRIVVQGTALPAVASRLRLRLTNEPAYLPASLGPWHVNGPHVAKSGDEALNTEHVDPQHLNLAETDGDGAARWKVPEGGLPDGVAHRVDGKNCANYFYRVVTAASPRSMDLSLDNRNAVRLWVNGRLVFDKAAQRGEVGAHPSPVTIDLREGENSLLMKTVDYYDFNAPTFFFARRGEELGRFSLSVEAALLREVSARGEEEVALLRGHYRSRHWPDGAPLYEKEQELRWAQGELEKAIPTTMVMEDRAEVRPTHILIRGEYDQLGDLVEPAVPAALNDWPAGAPPNRLGLAQWLVADENPLTARVAVNRAWQRYFGVGLVKTSDDFGVQGERPSHPELLDWLARSFIESGWDSKALERLIVTSATYRQASRIRTELADRDPENRLLARGPRYRLEAEQIRDSALAASGLLVEVLGGPSVKPYQPEGLWRDVAYGGGGLRYTAQEYIQEHGSALYRRSLYTFWKRAAAPPGMLLFDAPNRDVCTAQRGQSNTPLQALVLMNDIQYVEAARAIASRVMEEAGSDTGERIAHATMLVLSRSPRAAEASALRRLVEAQQADYRSDPAAARALVETGESTYNQELDPVELATWTMVASALLNTDAAVSQF